MKLFAVQATFIPIGMNELTKRVLFNIQISVLCVKTKFFVVVVSCYRVRNGTFFYVMCHRNVKHSKYIGLAISHLFFHLHLAPTPDKLKIINLIMNLIHVSRFFFKF